MLGMGIGFAVLVRQISLSSEFFFLRTVQTFVTEGYVGQAT